MIHHFIWLKFPFIRYAIALMGGILIGHLTNQNLDYLIISLAGLIFAYILLAIFTKTHLIGLVGLISITFLGLYSYQISNPREYSELATTEGIEYYSIKIERFLKESEKSLSYTGNVTHLKKRYWKKASSTIIIYIPKSYTKSFKIADRLLIRGAPKLLEKPANYGEFDYPFYLKVKGIFLRDFISEKRIVGIYSSEEKFSFIDSIRGYVTKVLRNTINSNLELGVAQALLLGDKNQLDYDLSKSYANSGTIHVLAVSGLHVGIIFIALSFLFKPIRNKWLRAILLISSLSVYAVLTGMSPSVLRATVMFSIVIMGHAITKDSGIYNSLGIAAFFLLLFNPMLLFSVGFQMSFLAVLSIVLFQPSVYALFPGLRGVGDYLWKLSSVSIAAQILTFPLGLYYFGQFPTYFIFSNLFVIPLVSLIVVLSFIVIIVYPIAIMSTPLGWINNKLLELLNSFVTWIGNLPYSVIEPDYFSIEVMVLIYGLIYFFYLLFSTKSFVHIIYFTMVTCLIISIDLYDLYKKSNSSIMLYSFRDPILLDFISRRTSFQYGEITKNKEQYSVLPTREKLRINRSEDIKYISLIGGLDFIVFKGRIICIVNSTDHLKTLRNISLNIDYLFINTKLSNKEMEDLTKSSISIHNLYMLPKVYHIFSF